MSTDDLRQIHINGRLPTPIYLQLLGQLKYVIIAGELDRGARLPSARHLAANLGLNRNTVQKVYAMLADEGYVETSRGKGTTVSWHPPASGDDDAERRDRLRELLDEVRTLARDLRLSDADITTLLTTQRDGADGARQPPVEIALVECNPASLSHFRNALESEFDVRITPLLLSELDSPTPAASLSLRTAEFIISTFFHFNEVRRAVRDSGVQRDIFAIGVKPHIAVVRQLEELHSNSVVGVLYVDDSTGYAVDRLRRMTDAIKEIALKQVAEVRSVLVTQSIEQSTLDGMDAVVVRPENVSSIRSLLPSELKVIEFRNEFDAVSRAYLKELLDELIRDRRQPTS